MRPIAPLIFVGQCPSSKKTEREIRKNPNMVLTGPSGRRLAKLCGVAYVDWLNSVERVNLVKRYSSQIPKRTAKIQAGIFLDTNAFSKKLVVLLGPDVASAFPFGYMRPLQWYSFGLFAAAIVPHPSGKNRWWNDKENTAKAAQFLSAIFI